MNCLIKIERMREREREKGFLGFVDEIISVFFVRMILGKQVRLLVFKRPEEDGLVR